MEYRVVMNIIIKAESILAPFRASIGEAYWERIVNDANSYIGRCDANRVTKHGEWKVTAKGIESKDGHKVPMDFKTPIAALIRFGMQLSEIAKAGSSDLPKHEMLIEACLPSVCESWFQERKIRWDEAAKDKEITAK